MTLRAVDLIAKKRDGEAHSAAEIEALVSDYTAGRIPDYQMSAWLMAVVWRGLTDSETFALTRAMVASGTTLDLSGLPGVPVDKHSTGGVGDKTTLAVAPILAASGVPVAKMSGRGLGHTGGTLDKLESIPGTRIGLTPDEIMRQVREIGLCVCAQTGDLVPADQKLYALRDATATVESLPLIAASVMSKKIACGSPAIVLDVKVGRGAFMKTLDQARTLSELMIRIGRSEGRRVGAVLSNMDVPLGRAVGNRLEVREVARLLRGDAAEPRLGEIVRRLSAVGLRLAGHPDPDAQVESALIDGSAWEKLRRLFAAQGGDLTYLNEKRGLAAVRVPVPAPRSGVVADLDALAIGQAAMRLGAGRATKEDRIDPSAGVILARTVGESVQAGETMAVLHTTDPARAEAVLAEVQAAYTLTDALPAVPPLIYDTLGLDD